MSTKSPANRRRDDEHRQPRTRVQRRRRAARERRRLRACPHPEKRAFGSIEATRRHAMKRACRSYAHGIPFGDAFAYLCPCGAWHLTSHAHGPSGPSILIRRVSPDLESWATGRDLAA